MNNSALFIITFIFVFLTITITASKCFLVEEEVNLLLKRH